MNPHCRIGKIKFKNGATIHVLPDKRAGEHDWLVGGLLNAVDDCVSARNGGMAGYVLVTWGADGSWSASVRYGEYSQIKDTMIPTFVGEALRRRLWRQDARYEAQSIMTGNDDDWH